MSWYQPESEYTGFSSDLHLCHGAAGWGGRAAYIGPDANVSLRNSPLAALRSGWGKVFIARLR